MTATLTCKDLDFKRIDSSYEVAHASAQELEAAASLLDGAVDVLDQYGWIRHSLGDCKVGHCAIGAMIKAQGRRRGRKAEEVYAIAETALAQPTLASLPYASVPSFNDNKAKNVVVVKAWMRRTAKRLRKLAAARS